MRRLRDEHRFEKDLAAKEKTDLEAKISAAAATTASSLGEAEEALAQALDAERRRHAEREQALQKRIDWYAENQDRLDVNDDKVKQQAAEIMALKQRLVDLETFARRGMRGAPATPKRMKNKKEAEETPARSSSASFTPPQVAKSSTPRRNAADVRTIKELREQLQDMAEALKKRNPNSVAASSRLPGHRRRSSTSAMSSRKRCETFRTSSWRSRTSMKRSSVCFSKITTDPHRHAAPDHTAAETNVDSSTRAGSSPSQGSQGSQAASSSSSSSSIPMVPEEDAGYGEKV